MSVYEIMSSSLSSYFSSYLFEKVSQSMTSDTNQKIVQAAGTIFSGYLIYKLHDLSKEIKKISEEDKKFSQNFEEESAKVEKWHSKIENQLLKIRSFPKIEEKLAKVEDLLMKLARGNREIADSIIEQWTFYLEWKKTDYDNLLDPSEIRRLNKFNYSQEARLGGAWNVLWRFLQNDENTDCSFLSFLDDCVNKNPSDLICLREYWKYLHFLSDRPDTTKRYQYRLQNTLIDFYPEA